MSTEPWVTTAVAILVAAHLVALVYVTTMRRFEGVEATDSTETAAEDGGRTCAECGTENEPGYRFCRSCVAELPGPTARRSLRNGRGQPY